MLSLNQAVEAVLGACGGMEPNDHLHFGSNKVWASNGALFAEAPVEVSGDFSVKASLIKNVLQKFQGAKAIHVDDQIKLKAGGARATVDTCGRLMDKLEFGGEPIDGWEGWLETLVEMAGAVNKDATHDWLRGILCYEDCTAVVGAGTSFMAWCDLPALGGARAILPAEGVLLIKGRQGLKNLRLGKGYFCAEFQDGVNFRSQMIVGDPPAVVHAKRKDWKTPGWEITKEWRESVLRACSLCDGVVTFENKKVTAADSGLFVEDDAGSGPITGNFSASTLQLMLGLAERASGDGFPLCWEGARLKGFMSGRGR